MISRGDISITMAQLALLTQIRKFKRLSMESGYLAIMQQYTNAIEREVMRFNTLSYCRISCLPSLPTSNSGTDEERCEFSLQSSPKAFSSSLPIISFLLVRTLLILILILVRCGRSGRRSRRHCHCHYHSPYELTTGDSREPKLNAEQRKGRYVFSTLFTKLSIASPVSCQCIVLFFIPSLVIYSSYCRSHHPPPSPFIFCAHIPSKDFHCDN